LTQFREQVKREHEQVVEIGGLHVLGTERHESRRIDNQLRGRSGRQGDPGSSRFYVSLQDDLMRLFASDRIMTMMDKLGMEEGQVIEHPWVSGALEVAQKRVENHNFEIRKQLLEYDNVMNKQREAIYHLRRSILNSDDVKARIIASLADVVNIITQEYLFSAKEETGWDWAGLETYLKTQFNFDISPKLEELKMMAEPEIQNFLVKGLTEAYESRERDIPAEHLRGLEKMVFLNTIDAKWKDHLYAMDQLKEGVGLRSYAQRDPLVEYKREGFMMFQGMYDSIYQEVIMRMFQIQPASPTTTKIKSVFSSLPQKLIHQDFSGISNAAATRQAQQSMEPPPGSGALPPSEKTPASQPYQKTEAKVGRNDPCPCGSGKKYKKCCGA
jgi:preprotein translocase subunit SecA